MQTPADTDRVTQDDLAALRAWEGRSEDAQDTAAPSTAGQLAATLDWPQAPAVGDELPALWHWTMFTPRAAQSAIGPDGHPRKGGFLPPVPLPRRMWAGGRLEWQAPLRVGDSVRRTSTIASITHKSGRSGDLVFVTVRHVLTGPQGPALTEEQDIVYRPAARPGDAVAAPQPAPADAAWSRRIDVDPVMLFRYSAVTFNGHRIHYDRSYATHEEGYPGLVVHGPLIATLLADLARRERPNSPLQRFSFRALRPTFDLNPFHVCGQPAADGRSANLWGRDHEGALTMQAEVQFR